jgi:hypothetical protein
MTSWATNSRVRLGFRRIIRGVIEAEVLGPVELLDWEDVLILRKKIAACFCGVRRGYRYAAWCAEVNLAIHRDGDPLRGLKGKASRPPLDTRGLSVDQLIWLAAVEVDAGRPLRKVEVEGHEKNLGELFKKMGTEKMKTTTGGNQ